MAQSSQLHTLADAQILIEQFLAHKKTSATEKIFLQNIAERINALQEVNHHWLKFGLIEEYELGTGPQPKQAELLREAKTAYKKKLAFVWLVATKLLSDLQQELKQIPDSHYKRLLQKTITITAIIIKNINPELIISKSAYYDRELKTDLTINKVNEIHLNENHRRFYSKTNANAAFIQALGGRYLPFKQSYDPLFGKSEGECFGYVADWVKQIERYGRYKFSPGLTKEIRTFQEHQLTYRLNKFRPISFIEFFFEDKVVNYEDTFTAAVDKIVARLDPYRLYELSATFYGIRSGHAMAIRKFPNSQAIEFFDSNVGIVVFDEEDAFKRWLSSYLCTYSGYLKAGGTFGLQTIGTQKDNATPSIPALEPHFNNVLKILEHDEVYKKSYYISPKKYDFDSSITRTNAELILQKRLNAFALFSISTHPENLANYHNALFDRLTKPVSIGPYSFQPNDAVMQESVELKKRVVGIIEQQISKLRRSFFSNNKITTLEQLILEVADAPETMSLVYLIKNMMRTKPNDASYQRTLSDIAAKLKDEEISIYKTTLVQQLFLQRAYEIAQLRNDPIIKNILENYKNKPVDYKQILLDIKQAAKNSHHYFDPFYAELKSLDQNNCVQLEKKNHSLEQLLHPIKTTPWTVIKNFFKRHQGKLILSLLAGLIAIPLIVFTGGSSLIIGIGALIVGPTVAKATIAGIALIWTIPFISVGVTTAVAAIKDLFWQRQQKETGVHEQEAMQQPAPQQKHSYRQIFNFLGINLFTAHQDASTTQTKNDPQQTIVANNKLTQPCAKPTASNKVDSHSQMERDSGFILLRH